jgi:hypothetical protein
LSSIRLFLVFIGVAFIISARQLSSISAKIKSASTR